MISFHHALEIGLVAVAYGLGCASTGFYLGRLRSGSDIRFKGSGSTGARNTGRILGNRAFIVVLAGDTAKGAVAAVSALLLGMPHWIVLSAMIAVLAGHIWPVQLGFRGGKGLAPSMGALLVLDFRLVLSAFAVAGIVWLLSRHSVGSGLCAVAATPFIALIAGHSHVTGAALFIMAAIILLAHRTNLRMIFAGLGTSSREES